MWPFKSKKPLSMMRTQPIVNFIVLQVGVVGVIHSATVAAPSPLGACGPMRGQILMTVSCAAIPAGS